MGGLVPKVSIIIPVLNGADYIDRIVGYLSEQTCQDFEVIFVVDSRSTDGSMEAASKYASPHVKVLEEINGPLGISRNTGLDQSSGEFIWFLDCDDRPFPRFLEKMLRIQDKYSADVVSCNFVYSANPDKDFGFDRKYSFKVTVMNSEEAVRARAEERFPVTAWCKIFRKSLLIDNDIRFAKGYCEDIVHTYRTISAADVICYYDEPLYIYYQHDSSFCNNNINSDRRGQAEQDAYENLEQFDIDRPEGFYKRKALVRIRSSGHMTYKSFKAFAKSPECREMLRQDCRGVPEAIWYRLSPTTYYMAIRLFFRAYYYREGRMFTVPERKHDIQIPEEQPLPEVDKKIPVTLGICAYNEERNIERTIRSVFKQKCQIADIVDVLVVSSGSTDRTDEIVDNLSKEFPKVKLIRQAKREGKNSAINLLFENKRTDHMVFLNADNVFESAESLDRLMEPFLDDTVGMVGGHPLPTNDPSTLAGYTVQLLWKMHHYVAVQEPKTGELIAFRDIGTRLPSNMQSDEDILRMKLEENGYRTVYAPDATILNRGPETVSDYLKQRTRVNIGENYMKKMFSYALPTHDYGKLMGAFINSVRELGFHPFRMLAALYLEIYPRIKARLYVRMDKGDMCVWDQVTTTKKL